MNIFRSNAKRTGVMPQSWPKQTRAPAIFDYTEAEWHAINAAVSAVQASPPLPEQRMSLLGAARDYHRMMLARLSNAALSPKARAKAWAKVARLCNELREELQAATSLSFTCGWDRDEYRIPIDRGECHLGALTTEEFLELLATAGNLAELRTEIDWVSQLVSYTGRLDPSVVYLQRILWLWTDIIGGKLSFSRSPKSGEPCGPMVRFLFAAARPVMKDATPSLESVRDIVRRQKAFYHWLDRCVAEFPSMAGAGDPRYEGDTTTRYDSLTRARLAASKLLQSDGVPNVCEIYAENISAQQRVAAVPRRAEAGKFNRK